MRPKKWQKIKKILDKALRLEISQREEYIRDLKLDDDLRSEIETLLENAEKTEHFLSASAASLTNDFFGEEEDSRASIIGQKIGSYEVVDELGIGGMGAVYLGRRTDGRFEQLVAVKTLKREFNTKSIRKNFEREIDIQARLNHPNIATLMDAGTTDDGIPYLIMEYVEGKPIDQFCRISRLSLDERLRLFIKACEAVSFAHRNLVIHRDLKPSNIIVSTDGEPKLLDFGISKKQVADADKPSTITNLGAMTPTYASPEQIKGEPLAITADLYSLGVILFKILTQLHPFGDTSIGHSALIETITTADPMLPSESRKSLTPEDEAGIGDLDFSKELKGDLDNIILKALRKEPERRYSTVDGLIDDLSRYLDGLPVNARPATIPYRAKKFYRRNKIPVLAGILAIFGLILGSSVAIWQASVARRQALVAESAQRSAERAAQKSKLEEENAKKITAFMEKMISYANPGLYAAGSDEQGNARVIDVINLMGTRIETEFPERKDLQAELHHKFAEVYVMIANPQFKSPEYREHLRRSRIHAKKALELRKEFFGEKHELVAKDLYYLWASAYDEETSSPRFLANAIRMMRETNPENRNLPYMLSDYANRIFFIGTKEQKASYLRELGPSAGQTPGETAFGLYDEALKHFEQHDGDATASIVFLKCRIAMVLTAEKKFAKASPYSEACRNPPGSLGKAQLEAVRNFVRQIDELKRNPANQALP